MDYATVTDTSPAGWVVEGLTGFALNVASVVPAGFEAYARILHPAELHDAPVSWREVAVANGRTPHSGMQWDEIVGGASVHEQPGVWNTEPDEGCLPQSVARPLAAVLADHTSAPDRCWFGLWEGFGGSRFRNGDTAEFEIPSRTMLLLTGPLDLVHTTSLELDPRDVDPNDHSVAVLSAVYTGPPGSADSAGSEPADPADLPFWQSPNLWWPDDRAWCVATEIDFCFTYVGGTRDCIDAILRHPGLEAYAVEPQSR